MINRARSFNPKKFMSNIDGYGISQGEKIHMEIVEKLFLERLDVLSSQKQTLRQILSARNQ